jgi:AcrR family transcriptional regulator
VTRKELLRAAAGLFLRDGFVATSLADIAAAAGVTKGAVYSNFASKEDLFLALLAEPASTAEMYAPRQLDEITGAGVDAARHFGQHAARVRPSRAHVALFLEANAVALRSERARQLTAANTRAFAIELGTGLRNLLDAPGADPLTLGLIAQSLYAGLLMHGAFLDEVDTATFETAYEALVAAAQAAAR